MNVRYNKDVTSGIVRLAHDHKEGVAGLSEKRLPRFQGK